MSEASPTEGGRYRQPIIAAAVELTADAGWAAVTMAGLAERVGVSRQTVYNEVGSKAALADAMISSELARFLSLVGDAFDRQPDDLVEAIYEAVRAVLDLAREHTLLRAIVSATHSADTELLPLLTTGAGSLLAEAKGVLTTRVLAYRPPLDDDQLAVVVDLVVRAVLSHVMRPSDPPGKVADGVAWMAARALDVTPRQSLRTAPPVRATRRG
ncbi:TetR/AcrR family transcriptional regulator [Amycolatopsis minnesotensis]|uniref:TetR/AcrR family transcriptional regulator n=2 Tax=Amycolatopsis minnesotensis TaxID=337894 RepID=A0ABN2R9R6_9PSEU